MLWNHIVRTKRACCEKYRQNQCLLTSPYTPSLCLTPERLVFCVLLSLPPPDLCTCSSCTLELYSLCSLASVPTFIWLILQVLPTSALSSLLQESLAYSGQFLPVYTYPSILCFPLVITVILYLCALLHDSLINAPFTPLDSQVPGGPGLGYHRSSLYP